jgi:radical SAM protein with 4Fe4S-binding SPASM domain
MKKTGPLFILPWRCTFSCDNNCIHCASAGKTIAKNELSTKQAFQLIDQIQEFGASWIGITGGESLLREDFFKIISYINKVGLKASLITDGHLLDKKKYEKIISNEVRVSISIDGTEEVNDRIRGKGVYKKTLSAIEEFSKNDLLNCLVYTFAKIDNSKSNLTVKDFRHVLDIAKEKKARWVIFHGFIPYSKEKNELKVDPSPDQYEWALNKLYDLNLIYRGKPEINVYCPFYARIAKQRGIKDFDNWFNNFFLGRCFFGKFMSITENGDAIPCSYNDVYKFGNIKEKAIKNIWKDLKNSTFFSNIKNKINLRGKCGICEYKKICGGCRTAALFYTGDILGSDPRCAYIPKALENK